MIFYLYFPSIRKRNCCIHLNIINEKFSLILPSTGDHSWGFLVFVGDILKPLLFAVWPWMMITDLFVRFDFNVSLHYFNYCLKLCFSELVLSLLIYVNSIDCWIFLLAVLIFDVLGTAISPIPLFFLLSTGLLRVLCWYMWLISSQLL